jgi:alpha-1,2-mannosyltransferase
VQRLNRPRAAILLAVSVAALLVGFRPWHWYLGDLVVYRGGASAVLHGRNLYTVVSGRDSLHFTYPPVAAVVMAPLAVIPLPVARIALSALTVCAVGGCLHIVIRRLGAEHTAFPAGTTTAFLAVALWLEPVRATLAFGQINALLMVLVVADVLVVRGGRAGGVMTGVAAAVKLTPLAFVPFLFVIGRARAAVTASAVFVGAALLGFVADPGASRQYWGHHLFLEAHRVGRVENASNQSIRGVLARLLKTQQVPSWWVLIALAVFVAGLWAAASLWRDGFEVWSLTAMAITALLVSPISWSHHWVWCVLMMVGCADLVRRAGAGRYAVAALAVMTPFVTAMIFWPPHTDHLELGDSPVQQLASAGYVIAGVVLVATMLAYRRSAVAVTASESRLDHRACAVPTGG